MKVCGKCKVAKPLDDFFRSRKSKDGRCDQCKACRRAYEVIYRKEHPEKAREVMARHRSKPGYGERRAIYMKSPARAAVLARYRQTEAGKTAPRRYALKKNYGLTLSDYNRMFGEQNGRCAICGEPPSEKHILQVDHCHVTGKVRSLLCFTCNAGLGAFGDDRDRLLAAVAYLMVHS